MKFLTNLTTVEIFRLVRKYGFKINQTVAHPGNCLQMTEDFAKNFLPYLLESEQAESKPTQTNDEMHCNFTDFQRPRLTRQEPIFIRKVQSITPKDRGLK